jgi:hypothetical protein
MRLMKWHEQISEAVVNALLASAAALLTALIAGTVTGFALYGRAIGDPWFIGVGLAACAAGISSFWFCFRRLQNPS